MSRSGYTMLCSWEQILSCTISECGGCKLSLEILSDGTSVGSYESDIIKTGFSFLKELEIIVSSSDLKDYLDYDYILNKIEPYARSIALEIRSLKNSQDDELHEEPEPNISNKAPRFSHGFIDQLTSNSSEPRDVKIVITKWPGGTMAMKFGLALQKALNVSEKDMLLVQFDPERVFNVKTSVSETEFRQKLNSYLKISFSDVQFIDIK